MSTTNPVGFVNCHSLKNRLGRFVWQVAYFFLFRPSPQFMGAWRSWLLRLFGAKIGFARLHQSVQIWAPWQLDIGKYVYIDKNVNLYNVYGLKLGDRVIISQGTFLCGATHDYTQPTYPLTGGKIVVGEDCWIAAEAFIAPGVVIGQGAVVGARTVVTKNVPEWEVVAGNPAKFIKNRILKHE